MDHYVKDQVIIVTGGSSGFGLETAKLLLAMDANVIITGRDQERLDAATSLLDSKDLMPVQADARRTEDWQRLLEAVVDRFGRLDVLVNNHGAGIRVGPTESMDDALIEAVLDTNITSVIKGCREAVRVMKPRGSGLIVNVSSACANKSWPSFGVYTAAKAGMVGFTRCLHLEMAEWGGRATNFVPGAANTNFCAAAGIDDSWLAGYPSAVEFARTLVHCIDIPPNCMIEEVRIWGTEQVKQMLNPF